MKTGIELIADERRRQIEVEGWTEEYDLAANNNIQLVDAAFCYLIPEDHRDTAGEHDVPAAWPWEWKWWKPTPDDRIRELTKAGALIAAEIDRLQKGNHIIKDENNS